MQACHEGSVLFKYNNYKYYELNIFNIKTIIISMIYFVYFTLIECICNNFHKVEVFANRNIKTYRIIRCMHVKYLNYNNN